MMDGERPLHDHERAEVTVDLNGCARCDGDGHAGLVFRAFVRPIQVGEGYGESWTFSHWALCPTTGEPILMAMTFIGEPTA